MKSQSTSDTLVSADSVLYVSRCSCECPVSPFGALVNTRLSVVWLRLIRILPKRSLVLLWVALLLSKCLSCDYDLSRSSETLSGALVSTSVALEMSVVWLRLIPPSELLVLIVRRVTATYFAFLILSSNVPCSVVASPCEYRSSIRCSLWSFFKRRSLRIPANSVRTLPFLCVTIIDSPFSALTATFLVTF